MRLKVKAVANNKNSQLFIIVNNFYVITFNISHRRDHFWFLIS